MRDIDTDPKLTAVLRALCERERTLQRPGRDTSLADLDALLDAEFRETGASGRSYTRELVLEALERRRDSEGARGSVWDMSEVLCKRLAPQLYLLTYLLRSPGRLTRRSSLWRAHAGAWKMLYHQGTVVCPPSDAT